MILKTLVFFSSKEADKTKQAPGSQSKTEPRPKRLFQLECVLRRRKKERKRRDDSSNLIIPKRNPGPFEVVSFNMLFVPTPVFLSEDQYQILA